MGRAVRSGARPPRRSRLPGRGARRALAGALAAAAAAACVDFVAVQPPRPLEPSARIAVRSVQEGDSLVVRLDGVLVGFTDPAVTLAGVPVPAVEAGYDSLRLELVIVLPATARSAELAMPFLPNAGTPRETVRIGMVRRDGEPSLDGGDLLLPWDGPEVPDANGTWTVSVRGAGDGALVVSGAGSPPRPLRLPAALLDEAGTPAAAELRLERLARGADTFYPLDLHLEGVTTWTLGDLFSAP